MKRIVFVDMSGLCKIIGVIEDQVPSVLETISPTGKQTWDLIAVKPRYALYRQPFAQSLGKLGEFHPEQK